MTEQAQTSKRRFRKYAQFLGIGIVIFITLGVVMQRYADGPTGPFAGGKLRTGELVTGQISDWTFAHREEVELELVEPATSRTVVTFAYKDQLYVPVTLGFFARRVPDYPMIGHVFLFFKHWHLYALQDGRVVLRIDGKRYESQSVRVTDPELLARLTSIVADAVAERISAPLIKVLEQDPEELWFFLLASRSILKQNLLSN